MSNSSTENIGIVDLKRVLLQTHIIDVSNIKDCDKGISWDGYLVVKKADSDKKEDFYGLIPVQIKTIHDSSSNNRFSISKVDLINYKKENRVMYFYIKLDDNEEKSTIYYLPLQLWDLDNMIKSFKNQDSKSFTFNRFPKKVEDVKKTVFAFIEESDKQKQLLPGISSIRDLFSEKGPVPVSFNLKIPNNATVFDLPKILEEDKPYLRYFSKDTKIEYVVGRLDGSNFSFKIGNVFNIVVGEKTYYENVSAELDNKQLLLNISDNLIFKFYKDKITFSFNFYAGNFEQLYNLSNFLKNLIKFKCFYVNSIKIPLDDSQIKDLSGKVSDKIEFLNKFAEVRRLLSISKEPDFIHSTDRDYIVFDYVYTSLIEKKPLEKLNIDDGLAIFDFFNLHVMLLAVSKKEKTILLNWNDKDCLHLCSSSDPNNVISPYFLLQFLEDNLFLKCDNIDIEKIEDNLFSDEINEFKCACINNIVINLISYYDVLAKENALNSALNICIHLKKLEKADLFTFINECQILYRKGQLTSDLKEQLQLIVSENDNEEIKFACYTLLDMKEKAKKCFEKLEKNKKELISKWPIYYLFKK